MYNVVEGLHFTGPYHVSAFMSQTLATHVKPETIVKQNQRAAKTAKQDFEPIVARLCTQYASLGMISK